MHHAIGLYVHMTWHTKWRRPCIRRANVPIITAAVLAAAQRTHMRVHAQAVLSDHVHVLLSFRPDTTISAFAREAKSESARRTKLQWCRGFYAGTLGRSQVRAVRLYIAEQFNRHPDRIPK